MLDIYTEELNELIKYGNSPHQQLIASGKKCIIENCDRCNANLHYVQGMLRGDYNFDVCDRKNNFIHYVLREIK